MVDKFRCLGRSLGVVTNANRGFASHVTMHVELEKAFNTQINAELFAGYTYLAMANYFGRQSVALPGCTAFFMEQVREERGHAKKFMAFICRRGGKVTLSGLKQPETQEWEQPLNAFKQALDLELDISQKLTDLHEMCQKFSDQYACNLIEHDFLDEQVESVNTISRHITLIQRMGTGGLATYLFDQYLLQQCSKQ